MTDSLFSLREVARRVRRDPIYVHGLADGLGIPLRPAGKALVMTGAEFDKVSNHLANIGSPLRSDNLDSFTTQG